MPTSVFKGTKLFSEKRLNELLTERLFKQVSRQGLFLTGCPGKSKSFVCF